MNTTLPSTKYDFHKTQEHSKESDYDDEFDDEIKPENITESNFTLMKEKLPKDSVNDDDEIKSEESSVEM